MSHRTGPFLSLSEEGLFLMVAKTSLATRKSCALNMQHYPVRLLFARFPPLRHLRLCQQDPYLFTHGRAHLATGLEMGRNLLNAYLQRPATKAQRVTPLWG